MPTQDKARKTWTGRVALQGQPVKTKRGFKTKMEARKWEEHQRRILKGEENPVYLILDGTDAFLLNCQRRCKPYTCESKANILNQFINTLPGNIPIPSITTIACEKFLAGYPGKTANRYLRELNTFFIFCIKRQMIQFNPISPIEKFQETPYRRYVPPAADIEAIKEYATPMEHDMITFAYNTLSRAGEIRKCKWEDVDLEKKTITLWTAKRRGGNKEDDTLDMTDTLHAMLTRRRKIEKGEYVFTRKGKPVTKRFLDTVMPKLCKKAKVPLFPVHGIRHHVAALLTYKLSLAQISKILRHRRMTTTDIYLRSIVKIETKGIKVLDEIGTQKIVPFLRSVK